jgi:tubulin---tyrosine ligase
VDFLVVDEAGANGSLGIRLLEINAEPAIELTGPRLSWILKDLFIQIGKTCVEPFFDPKVADSESWSIGDIKEHFIKCFDARIRCMSGI